MATTIATSMHKFLLLHVTIAMVLFDEYFYILGRTQKFSALSIGLRYPRSKVSPTCHNIGSNITLKL